MAGHLFITRGNLAALQCDAWLLPTDAYLHVTFTLDARLSDAVRTLRAQWERGRRILPDDWGNQGSRVLPLLSQDPLRPQPYLTNVGAAAGYDVEWYLAGVRQFLEVVAQDHRGPGRVTRRPLPLIGVPLIGTGAGGAHAIKGAVVAALLDELRAAVERYDLDIALVLYSAPAFAAAQNARRRSRDMSPDGAGALWPDLSSAHQVLAEKLARRAVDGRLVLFLGAGVSVGAGLPTWGALLEGVATEAGLEQEERAALAKLDFLDQARILERRLNDREQSLGATVAARLRVPQVGLTHTLLAALPVRESVTTNYDPCFETASRAAGRQTAVLPYEPAGSAARWLLKLHGCVEYPEDIVLTREHYLRYGDRRAALAGIVQAMLMTSHMLFVGYSLQDTDFHQLVDEVRKALRRTETGEEQIDPFGTTLLLAKNDLLAELWRSDLEVATVGRSGDSTAHAARRLEIFLDYLLSEATVDASPLLDPAFDGVLSEEERAVRRLLQDLERAAEPQLRRSPAWRLVGELLHRLGGSPYDA